MPFGNATCEDRRNFLRPPPCKPVFCGGKWRPVTPITLPSGQSIGGTIRVMTVSTFHHHTQGGTTMGAKSGKVEIEDRLKDTALHKYRTTISISPHSLSGDSENETPPLI
jgi:hypothetical protein